MDEHKYTSSLAHLAPNVYPGATERTFIFTEPSAVVSNVVDSPAANVTLYLSTPPCCTDIFAFPALVSSISLYE